MDWIYGQEADELLRNRAAFSRGKKQRIVFKRDADTAEGFIAIYGLYKTSYFSSKEITGLLGHVPDHLCAQISHENFGDFLICQSSLNLESHAQQIKPFFISYLPDEEVRISS